MNWIPLVEHELRAGVRRPRAFRTRLAAGGAAVGICCWGLLVWADWRSAASLGHSLLEMLGWTGFISAALAGLFLTSDCISQERREGTLGLLFLTDLRGRDVAFGKLAAKGLTPVYCLLAMLPALTVCVIVGGVTAGEVWRLWLVLLNTLFFSLSMAILTSTFCRHQRAAQAVAVAAIFLGIFSPPLLGPGFASASSTPLVPSIAFVFSPACNYLLAYDARYRGASGSFWVSLLVTDLLAWGCLWAAGRLLPRMSSEETSLFIRVPGARRPRLLSLGVAKRQRSRRELLSKNPITWLASRDGWKQHSTWFLPTLALWIWLRFDPSSAGGASARISFAAFAAIHALFKVWVGSDASHVFASDRLSGTLELLLSTPLQTREVAAGMLSAFRRRFVGPLAALLVLDAAFAVKMLSVGDQSAAFAVVAGAAMLLADSYCLCWVGLWRGLTARDPVRAILATLWRVLVLPWFFFAAGFGIFRQSTLAQFAGMWLFLGLLTDAVLWINARDFFHGHFRAMALRPFGEKPPRVESKWSPMNWEEEPDGQAAGP